MLLSKARLQASSSPLAPCLPVFYSTTSIHSYSDTSPDQNEEVHSRDSEVFDSMIRVANLSTLASAAFLQGLGHSKSRQDARFILEGEKILLSETSRMMQDSQSRPSALQLAARVGYKGAGIAASLLPPLVRNSVLAGLSEAVEDSCIDQLRELRAKGLSDSNPELRSLLMRIRDHSERVPEGAPQVPDITSLPEVSRLKPDQALAFIVKQGTSTLLHMSQKL